MKKTSETYLLTDIQKDILTGNLLGDGSLSKITERIKNSLFEIKQKLDKSEYIESLFNAYEPFSKKYSVGESIDSRSGKVTRWCKTRTIMHPIFTELEKKWYLRDAEDKYICNVLGHRIKIVPQDIKLSDVSLAIWICDDGSNWDGRRFTLHTDCFSFSEVEFLINKISADFNINGKINKKNNKPLIVFCGDNAFDLMELTKCFIPKCYKYKTLNRLSKYNSRIHDKI